jgi:hypothetical protein
MTTSTSPDGRRRRYQSFEVSCMAHPHVLVLTTSCLQQIDPCQIAPISCIHLRASHAHTVWHRSLHHQGRNKFLCGGRVMLGSDANHFWVTIVVTTIPIAVFISLVYVFECQWSERGWQNGGRCARARVCMCVCVCGCVCCMRYVRERVYMCGIRVALSSPHIFSST